jgi:hypothetical protein
MEMKMFNALGERPENQNKVLHVNSFMFLFLSFSFFSLEGKKEVLTRPFLNNLAGPFFPAARQEIPAGMTKKSWQEFFSARISYS